MISPNAIKALFEKIAKTHTGIGHNPPDVIRFYGFNNDEAIGGEQEDTEYPRMGLSLRTHTGMSGNYNTQHGAVGDRLLIEVVLLNKIDKGDFDDEYDVYDDMKRVMDEIISWLEKTIHTDEKCDFPAVHQLDLSSVTYQRVGPVHSNAFGWRFQIPISDSFVYNAGTNPLNAMTPDV